MKYEEYCICIFIQYNLMPWAHSNFYHEAYPIVHITLHSPFALQKPCKMSCMWLSLLWFQGRSMEIDDKWDYIQTLIVWWNVIHHEDPQPLILHWNICSHKWRMTFNHFRWNCRGTNLNAWTWWTWNLSMEILSFKLPALS